MALTKVSTDGVKDQGVDLTKLPHGTSSNDGKFLRANNGADPTFETVSGTTINNNADNRVITGSDTANTLNGESNVVIDANGKLGIGTTSPANLLHLKGSGHDKLLVESTGTNHAVGMQIKHASGDATEQTWQLQTHTGADSKKDLAFRDATAGSIIATFRKGGGITFNGDTAAANAIDDYEEGTYTANLEVTSGSFTATNSNQLNYVKIGSFVYVNGVIGFSSPSSPGGDLRFDLPFASSSTGTIGSAEGCCGAIWNYYGASNPHGNYGWYPLHAAGLTGGSSTDVNLGILGYNGTNSNWGPIGNLVGNNGLCQFSFSYRTG